MQASRDALGRVGRALLLGLLAAVGLAGGVAHAQDPGAEYEVRWTYPEEYGGHHFEIQTSLDGGATWETRATTDDLATRSVVLADAFGALVQARVRAVNSIMIGGEWSPVSEAVAFTRQMTIPGQPSMTIRCGEMEPKSVDGPEAGQRTVWCE